MSMRNWSPMVIVASCVAMFRAFRYDLATTPRLMHVSDPDHLATELSGHDRARHDVSATLAGLVAVRSIPIDTCEVHEKTGALTIKDPVDPLGPDIVDTVTEGELEEAEAHYRAAHQNGDGG